MSSLDHSMVPHNSHFPGSCAISNSPVVKCPGEPHVPLEQLVPSNWLMPSLLLDQLKVAISAAVFVHGRCHYLDIDRGQYGFWLVPLFA